MIKYEEFAELLKKYNIDVKIILEKNRKTLKKANYKEVEDILDYLKNIKILGRLKISQAINS